MLLAVPIAVWPDSYNLTYIKEIIMSIGMILLFFAFIMSKDIKISMESLCVLFIPACMALSYIFSPYKDAALPVLYIGVISSVIFIILANQTSVSKESQKILVLVSSLPVIMYGVCQILFPDIFKSLLGFNQRIPSTLGNPNFFAAYILALFPFILTAADRLKNVKRAGMFFMAVLLLFILYRTGSKGAHLALALEMAVFAAITYSKQEKLQLFIKKNLLTLIIAFIAIIAAMIMLFYNTDSMKFRINVWAGTIKLIAANPVLGTGPGSFAFAFPAYRPAEIIRQSYMHSYEVSYPENIFLQAAAEYGLLGLAALVFILWIILKKIDPEKKDYYAAFCGLLAVNLTGVDINFGTSAMMSAVFAGVLLNGRQNRAIALSPAWEKAAAITVTLLAAVIMLFQLRTHISDIYLKKAIYLSETKQWQASIENYKKALIYNPQNAPAGYFLAGAYYDSGPETNADAALDKYTELEKSAPNYVLLHYKKAVILNASGRQGAAIKEYLKMIKVDPYLKPALTDLAFIYYKKGDLTSAEDYIKKACDASPDAALYNNLGNIYFMQKRITEAISAYKKAIEINPDKDYYYNLGCVYFTLNDIANAKMNIYKAAEIDSKNIEKEPKIRNMMRLIARYEKVTKR